ncbi:glutathione S-transferase family protein [Chromobacterium subtsugae]|uniref:Glutathione S-transferase family protein n=1 Tax=Chromobacterium subtsugae TaxID=251747 RepID=A0ABS7FIP6_9NEIS|nr:MULTISPECIES: glutathione S-transferase family protein [Chromobacterium]KUM03806.1 glutathione S-transferase [Chromobacterium subtsugae]KZE85529.1 glutathione S-transferase [Chromobacterium sp. F49]MBW7568930.1 glutathione S-transferase family protein [Chromobacterium subtsugae]MBW8289950.1 glutathione S-transferase family protein [Chromobacterium subtsugae]OBU84759.1 glutathione S-transferase [Chromobacterium subtsugae]
MSNLILYGNRYSGHSYKVRLALMLADISHDYVHVDISQPRAERLEDFRAASRFGEVPVLVADGVPLCQSNAILQWLADSYGALGGALGERQRVREWLNWETNRLGLSLPNLRYSRLIAHYEPAVEAWLETRLRADLAVLETELAERRYLAGDQISIADVSLCGYLWWLADTGLAIADWPHVQAWLARIAAQPGWQHPDELMSPDIPE